MEASIKFEDGIVLGEKNFADIKAKGKRYIERNTPKYVREFLWIPFYTTVEKGSEFMYVIHLPTGKPYEKIFFKRFLIIYE